MYFLLIHTKTNGVGFLWLPLIWWALHQLTSRGLGGPKLVRIASNIGPKENPCRSISGRTENPCRSIVGRREAPCKAIWVQMGSLCRAVFCQIGQTETPCKAIWFKQQIRASDSESLCQLGSDLGASPRRLPGRVR